MLKIRLARFGRKKAPTYRLAVSEHQKDTQGDALEYVGSYNPRSNPKFIQLNIDRIKHWLSKGAGVSPTVHNLLVDQGVIKDKKVQAFRLVKTVEEKKPEATTPTPATDEAPAPATTETPAEEPKTE